MTTITCFIALLLSGQVSDVPGRYATKDGNPLLEPAYIRVKDEAKIPAVEQGVLTDLLVREGMRVKKDEQVAQIDDREAKATVEVTRNAEKAAIRRYEQDIEERYAEAASKVAEADYRKDLDANRIKPGAVPESEMERKKLDWKRATLQIEKAQNDQLLAGYDAKTKRAERQAAEMALDWRTIRAPFDGDVVKTYVHQSEWVNPGDPILKLMRFDTLYVEGFVKAAEYDRWEVMGKPVTVEVTKARGKKASVAGKIVHVAQMLEHGGIYTVRAEVANELVNDSWLLQPGGVARMTIHLDGTAQAINNVSRN